MKKQKKDKTAKRNITRDQFLAILHKAAQPVKDWQQSDSGSKQTSRLHHVDDYAEKNTHSDRIEVI